MIDVRDDFFSEDSISTIKSFMRKNGSLNGTLPDGNTREIFTITPEMTSTIPELEQYTILGGFYAESNEPFKIHCDLRPNSTMTHNLCVSIDPVEEQSITIFEQTVPSRCILVDTNTDPAMLEFYSSYTHPWYTIETIRDFAEGMRSEPAMTEEKRALTHVSAECLPYLDVDRIVTHRYNRAILFPANRLHCGSMATTPQKRLVLYVQVD